MIAARQGDASAARAYAERALAIRPELPRAQIAVAQADIAEGAPGLAEKRLTWLLGRTGLAGDMRAEAFHYLAESLDALDRPGEAFHAYETRNGLLSALYGPSFSATVGERWVDQARRLARYFERAAASHWREPAGADREGARTAGGHVFLMGFPRSGTTLLEQVLASHPQVVSLEESPALGNAAGYLLADEGALERLSDLTFEEADVVRGRYWAAVRNAFDEDLAEKILIDKLPLHTAALPVIAKLFPGAKILFARRDPRDVVLSCYRRRFRVNTAMFEFLTLKGAADFYCETINLSEIYFQKLSLNVREVVHERLVENFEPAIRELLAFIGLEWDAAIWNFPERAKTHANTPSGPQIARGLNSEGIGQWRRYEKQLAPVLSVLEPWVRRFGYPATETAELSARNDPRIDARVDQIGEAMRGGAWDRAFEIAQAALAEGLRHPLFHRLRAIRFQQQGRLAEAIEDFEAALRDAPGDFGVLNALGLALARNGRQLEGMARLDRALAINPAFAPAHYNRGWALETLGDLPQARVAYEKAVEIDPRHAQAMGSLAALDCRTGKWRDARAWAQKALELESDQPVALTALAKAEAADGRLALAERQLRMVLSETSRSGLHERAVAFSALGDVLDQMDRPREAFAAYEAAGAVLSEIYRPRLNLPATATTRSLVGRLSTVFAGADRARWNRIPASDTARPIQRHVFLVGFPRSGSTMLGQALAVHPDVVTLDEHDTMDEALRNLFGHPDGLERIATLSDSEAELYRAQYLRRVAAKAPPADKVLVDKHPMNLIAVPLIAKLFPAAKIIVMRRDPRDVVFSAFRRVFAINPTTIEFLSLADTASFYDQVMALDSVYHEQLALPARHQSYERLVEDFDAQMREICAHIDLDWRPGLADFAGRANSVATPSGAQLALGLNRRGVGSWRAYRRELEPILPILDPWIERFGYGSS